MQKVVTSVHHSWDVGFKKPRTIQHSYLNSYNPSHVCVQKSVDLRPEKQNLVRNLSNLWLRGSEVDFEQQILKNMTRQTVLFESFSWLNIKGAVKTS